jgi:two-component system, OmpR family, sensor histidine kinase ChvG
LRRRPWRSLVAKAAMLGLIFVIVPAILYSQFKAADDEKQMLLRRSVRDQGRVMAQALQPILAATAGRASRGCSRSSHVSATR